MISYGPDFGHYIEKQKVDEMGIFLRYGVDVMGIKTVDEWEDSVVFGIKTVDEMGIDNVEVSDQDLHRFFIFLFVCLFGFFSDMSVLFFYCKFGI